MKKSVDEVVLNKADIMGKAIDDAACDETGNHPY